MAGIILLFSATDDISSSLFVQKFRGKARLPTPKRLIVFSLAVATCWETSIGLRLFRFEYDDLRMCMK